MIKAVVDASLKCIVIVAQRSRQYTYVSQCVIYLPVKLIDSQAS